MKYFKFLIVFAVLTTAISSVCYSQDTSDNFWGTKQDSIFIDRNQDTLYVAGSIEREYIPLMAIMANPDYEDVVMNNSANLKLSLLNSGLRFNLYELYQWFAKYYLLNWISNEINNPLISLLMDFAFLYLIPDLLGLTNFNYAFYNSTVPNYYYTGNQFTTISTPNYKPVLSTPMPRTGLHHETYTKSDSVIRPVRISDPVPVSDNRDKTTRKNSGKKTVKKKESDDGFNIFDIIFGNKSDDKNNETGNKPKTETGNKPKTETGNRPNTETKPKTETPKTETPKTETKPKNDNNTGSKPNNTNTEKKNNSKE